MGKMHWIHQGECMKRLSRAVFLLVAATAVSVLPITEGRAQVFPSRPVTIVVPFAAGGPTDVVARIVGERMAASLGQAVIIENVTGADGVLGVGRVVRAPADGYTVSIGMVGTHVLNGAAYTLPYDLIKDLAPVALISSNPYVLIAKKSVPAKNLDELIGWIKANPGKTSIAVASMTQRVSAAYFQKMIGANLLFVPYRGAGPALQDMLAGQVDLMFDQPTNFLAQVKAGNAKAFAVAADAHLEAAPEIPTTDEAGLNGLYILSWNGAWVPKGTPPAIIAKLNAAIIEALATPALQARFAELGTDVPPLDHQSPEWLAEFQRDEIEKWWPIVKAANIRGE
jgi:tripartite-type tricarboxylate transporter receptor subunit TctC